jgi:hypothetical protein
MSLLFAAVAALALQTAPDPAEAEIAAVLDRLNAASTAADGPAYFGLFTPRRPLHRHRRDRALVAGRVPRLCRALFRPRPRLDLYGDGP